MPRGQAIDDRQQSGGQYSIVNRDPFGLDNDRESAEMRAPSLVALLTVVGRAVALQSPQHQAVFNLNPTENKSPRPLVIWSVPRSPNLLAFAR